MNRTRFALWICATFALALGGFALADRQLNRGLQPTSRPGLPANRHYVAPAQLSQAATESSAAGIVATDHHGKPRAWADLSEGRPVVLVFVKDGCPCSVEFEPYFHRLAAACGDAVRFATIINGDVATARRFADENQVPYPVLADVEHDLITYFRAEHGATVVLLSPAGRTEARWPGCSRDMMQELSGHIARVARVEERTIDVAGLPGALTAGCAYSR